MAAKRRPVASGHSHMAPGQAEPEPAAPADAPTQAPVQAPVPALSEDGAQPAQPSTPSTPPRSGRLGRAIAIAGTAGTGGASSLGGRAGVLPRLETGAPECWATCLGYLSGRSVAAALATHRGALALERQLPQLVWEGVGRLYAVALRPQPLGLRGLRHLALWCLHGGSCTLPASLARGMAAQALAEFRPASAGPAGEALQATVAALAARPDFECKSRRWLLQGRRQLGCRQAAAGYGRVTQRVQCSVTVRDLTLTLSAQLEGEVFSGCEGHVLCGSVVARFRPQDQRAVLLDWREGHGDHSESDSEERAGGPGAGTCDPKALSSAAALLLATSPGKKPAAEPSAMEAAQIIALALCGPFRWLAAAHPYAVDTSFFQLIYQNILGCVAPRATEPGRPAAAAPATGTAGNAEQLRQHEFPERPAGTPERRRMHRRMAAVVAAGA